MVLCIAKSTSRTAVVLLALLMFVIAGCSGDDSPMAPTPPGETEPPPEEIKTPSKMRITHILVQWTAINKSNGDTWDLDLINATNRKPDIYFKLGNYTTNVLENYDASDQVNPERLNFSPPSYGQMNYVGKYTLQLYDKDTAIQGADDLMGSHTFSPGDYYGNDNRTDFSIPVVVSGKFSVYCIGVWIY